MRLRLLSRWDHERLVLLVPGADVESASVEARHTFRLKCESSMHTVIESDINKNGARQATDALGRYPTTVYRRMSGAAAVSSGNLERAFLKCADCKCASRSASLFHSSTNVKSVGSAVF